MIEQQVDPSTLPWDSLALGDFFHIPKALAARIEVRSFIKQQQAKNPGRRYYLESFRDQWRVYRLR